MPYTLNVFTGQFDYYASLAIGSSVLNGTTGSVLFIGSSGEIAQDNTNFFWDDTNNILKLSKLHIGAASATLYPFNLDATPVLSGTSYLAANFIATYTPSANFSDSVTGFFAQTTLPLGGYDATGTIAGGFGSVRITGSGTVNITAGFRGVVTNVNTAVVTEAQCFRASIAGNLSSGSITTLSSFYSPDQTAGTSNVGFNGNISSGSNKWNLYMGGTAKNYLNGSLGIRSLTPAHVLDVREAGNTEATIGLYGSGLDQGYTVNYKVFPSRNTVESPSAPQSGDVLFAFGANPYGATAYASNSVAALRAFATENYTDSAMGTKWAIATTPNGSVTKVNRIIVGQDGNVGIGVDPATAYLHIQAGTTAASTAPIKLTSGSFNTTAEAGAMEYNNVFALTESDATRRYIVQAAASTKTTAGAPYTNDGYVTVRINGVDVKLMTTA